MPPCARAGIRGIGRPRREFPHLDDLADAVVFLMKTRSDEAPINIGTGTDIPIAELAKLIAGIIGFKVDLSLINQNRTQPRVSFSTSLN
jgi:GDP-L-fucose synthase